MTESEKSDMSNNEQRVDWNLAPNGTTHWCANTQLWYKVTEDESVHKNYGDGEGWKESIMTADEVRGMSAFIPRPVSSEQPVSAPPLGLTPKNIWEEQMQHQLQHQRRQDIHAAMQRYIGAGKEIPNNWLYELAQLNLALKKIETDFAEAIQSSPVAKDGEWIEWGKEAYPNIPDHVYVEKVYSDGDVKTGKSGDTSWFGKYGLDDKPYVVTRYRIIGE